MCVQLKENHRENQSNCGLDDLTNKFILCAKHPMKNSSHLTIREVKQLFYVLTVESKHSNRVSLIEHDLSECSTHHKLLFFGWAELQKTIRFYLFAAHSKFTS